jgi:hypothetical protein
MEFPFSKEEWSEILERLYKRAASDHQFHVLCTRDAHSAIKLICGRDIPKNVGLRFEPQHTDELVMVLPRENKDLFHPLSDEDLRKIAEGMSSVTTALAKALETRPAHFS